MVNFYSVIIHRGRSIASLIWSYIQISYQLIRLTTIIRKQVNFYQSGYQDVLGQCGTDFNQQQKHAAMVANY